MSVPSFSPNLVRVIGVVAVVATVSAIASAQRFGGSGQAAQQASQTPGPQTGQTAPPSNGRGTPQNRSSQEPFSISWEWWKDDAVRKEMRLTDPQVRGISRLYDNRVRTLKPVAEELSKQRDVLDKMSQERTVDVPVYAIQVNHVEALRSEMNRTRTIMLYEIQKALTPEQTQKFREIVERRRKARGSGGQR